MDIIKVSFGRCNIPHYGHVHLINKCDTFVLSSGKKNLPSVLRLKALVDLGINKSKIIFGNPYKELSNIISKNPNKVIILLTEDNIGMGMKLNNPIKILPKKYGVSSSLIRDIIDKGDYNQLNYIYKGNKKAIDNAITLRETELKWTPLD